MNAESEMQTSDGLGGDAESQGTIYALAVVLEADSREEAFDRIAGEVGPEPANAHFVGEPFEIERAGEYDSRGVAVGILDGIRAEEAQQGAPPPNRPGSGCGEGERPCPTL